MLEHNVEVTIHICGQLPPINPLSFILNLNGYEIKGDIGAVSKSYPVIATDDEQKVQRV